MFKTIFTVFKCLWAGLRPSKNTNKKPLVRIHLIKNGFYAKEEDIFSHPNVPRQLALLNALIERQNREAAGKEATSSDS